MNQKKEANNSFEHFVINWSKFPLDWWWRKKYNVPFGSAMHKEQNFIDMAIEFCEDRMFAKAQSEVREEEEFEMPINGKQVVKMTQDEIEKDFDNLDLDSFNDI